MCVCAVCVCACDPPNREQKVDVTVYTLRNGIVRVEDSEETLYASIDIVCDKLQRKMVKVGAAQG